MPPGKALAIIPPVPMRGELVSSRIHVGQLHAETVELVLIALRQEAAYLAQKSLNGQKLSRTEAAQLSEIALALVALDRGGTAKNAQAMLRAVEREAERKRIGR